MEAFEVVAEHLRTQAIERKAVPDGDSFGRSAFNRYYYATFLSVRIGLGEFQKEWLDLPHANVPEVLSGQVLRKIKDGLSKARKLDDGETVSLCSRAKTAAELLAKLMIEAKNTRTTADYHPEIHVKFSPDNDFQLNSITVSQARAWPRKASLYMNTITSAWAQIE